MTKFFYIIMRDGQIFEVPYTEQKIKTAFDLWAKKGLIIFQGLGAGINGADVTKILDADQYKNYVDTAQPRLFIRNGVWYDGKYREQVRIEPWRQLEIDNAQKKLDEPKVEVTLTPERAKKLAEIKKDLAKKFGSKR